MSDFSAAQRPIVKVEHPHVYLVPSSSDPRKTYKVILGDDFGPSCDCAAYVQCKHVKQALAFDKQAVADHYVRMAAETAEANHA